MYNVELKPKAQKFIASQSKRIQRQLIKRIEFLAVNPHPPNSKMLHGKEKLYSLRSGSYRIIYQVEHEKLVIVIATVGHRGNVYDRLAH
ncbi:MAG: type II toxin-antitoxin system RelE/ParE family toxin [Sedimentisphaerales bacterium]|nr:type II toxin-antitoxin system RelE/ParE family toxin [Sedimentisphaerales bacterium]